MIKKLFLINLIFVFCLPALASSKNDKLITEIKTELAKSPTGTKVLKYINENNITVKIKKRGKSKNMGSYYKHSITIRKTKNIQQMAATMTHEGVHAMVDTLPWSKQEEYICYYFARTVRQELNPEYKYNICKIIKLVDKSYTPREVAFDDIQSYRDVLKTYDLNVPEFNCEEK